MGSPLIHFELVADNPEGLADFYRKLFDWKIEKFEGGMDYWNIDTGSMPGGGMAKREGPEQIQTIYFDVPSIEQHLEKAQQLGAKVIVEKTPVEQMGWIAQIVDPQGNMIGLWETNPEFMAQQESEG
jgi:predicted enzyme related to lactoylglutathione lyase